MVCVLLVISRPSSRWVSQAVYKIEKIKVRLSQTFIKIYKSDSISLKLSSYSKSNKKTAYYLFKQESYNNKEN